MFEINQLRQIPPVEEVPATNQAPAMEKALPSREPDYPSPGNTPQPSPQQRERSPRKQQVIDASRRKYGRSREAVEKLVYEQLGVAPAPQLSPAQQQLTIRLLEAGLDDEGARYLLERYDVERIKRQLDWLPQRSARNPAGLLFAAIEHDYDAPHHFTSMHHTLK